MEQNFPCCVQVKRPNCNVLFYKLTQNLSQTHRESNANASVQTVFTCSAAFTDAISHQDELISNTHCAVSSSSVTQITHLLVWHLCWIRFRKLGWSCVEHISHKDHSSLLSIEKKKKTVIVLFVIWSPTSWCPKWWQHNLWSTAGSLCGLQFKRKD